jgi:hypothetical protein
MATIPFALSIHHFISSVGADAGFAAIIGLAIMVLLFFSQARETATLRRRADEAEGQLRQLAAYVDQLLRRPAPARPPAGAVALPPAAARVAARPAAAMAAQAVSAPVAAGVLATIPAAPAGVGAPALSAATRLIPLADPDEISIRSLKNGNGGEPSAAVVTDDAPAPAAPAPPSGPPPSTPAGGANGSARLPVAPDGPEAHEATPPPFVPDAPAPRVALRREGAPPSSRPAQPPTFNDPIPPRRRLSRFGLGAIVLVGLAVVVAAVLLVVTSGGGKSSASSSSAASNSVTSTTAKSGKDGRHRTTTVTVTPSSVTVAVLNGTVTPLLAAHVMSKLHTAGYQQGGTGNAPNQTASLAATTIDYAQPGTRNDALAVAKSLGLTASSVKAVTAANLNAACQSANAGTTTAGSATTPAGACSAQVVVTVGNDLASSTT